MKPLRTCIGCRQTKEKDKLLRITYNGSAGIKADPEGTHEGRGAYVCRDAKCIEAAYKKGGFNRAFKRSFTPECLDSVIRDLRSCIDDPSKEKVQ